jgi:putative two-component system response regulator
VPIKIIAYEYGKSFLKHGSSHMSDTVLFVDDEEQVLDSIDGIFSRADMTVIKTASAREAIEIVNQQSVAVIVSDNRMPEMTGIDLLTRIRDISPDTLKILMTAPSDLAEAVDAINNGQLFRFVLKPWDNRFFVKTVQEAVSRYRIIHTIKYGDEAALLSVANDVESKDPFTIGHAERVAHYATKLAELFGLPEDILKAVKYGSYLHDCGKMRVPENILNKRGRLDKDEYEIIKNHPRWGADIAIQAALGERIINIVHYHHERFDGSGYPSGMKGNEIPFEAQIVAVADVYDALTSDRCFRTRFSDEKAVEILLLMRGNVFEPGLIDSFIQRCLRTMEKGPSADMINTRS